MMININNKMKTIVIRRKPKKIYGLKVNPLNKWTASNTCGVISVAT